MVKYYKILFFAFFILFCNSAYAQNFEAFVDSEDVAVGQTLNLKLELTGTNPAGVPDMSTLPIGLKISGQSQQSSVEIVNGRQASSISWIYNILPSVEGSYNIPEISIATDAGTLYTRPFKINVKDSRTLPQSTPENSVFIEATLNKENVFLGEPAIYTVRIYSKYQLNDADLKKPVSEGLVFDQIGDPKVSKQIFNGENYNLVTVDFLVTPTKSGRAAIGASVLKGRIALPSDNPNRNYGISDPLFDGVGAQYAITPFTIASKTNKIQVKEPIKNIAPWLPAQKLEVKDEVLNNAPETQIKAKVGEPFTRKIYLAAEGRFGKSLPDIEKLVENENFKIYADKATETGEIKFENNNYIILGKKTQSFSYIPQKTGEYELPEIKINWWNTNTDSLQTAIIPSHKILVEGDAAAKVENTASTDNLDTSNNVTQASQQNSSVEDKPAEQPTEPLANNTQVKPLAENNIVKSENLQITFEQILIGIVLLSCIILIILKFVTNKKPTPEYRNNLIRPSMRVYNTNQAVKNNEAARFFSSNIDEFLNLKSVDDVSNYIQNYAEANLKMPKNSSIIAISENLIQNFNFDSKLLEAAKMLDGAIFAGKEINLTEVKKIFSVIFDGSKKMVKTSNDSLKESKNDFDKLNPF